MSRIDSGTILVAFFAILFGLIGAFLLRKSLQTKNAVVQPAPEVRRGPKKITVPLASRNLESGTRITLDDVALFSLTREEMKEHGIKRVFMSNPDQIIGKTVAVDLARGSTFDTKDFYAPGTGPGISDKLQLGQRAVTIDVTATSALLGFAGAGQNVDVLFHFGRNSSQNSDSTRYYGDRDLNDRYNNDSGRWQPEHFDYNPPQGLSGNGGAYTGDFDRRRRQRQENRYQSATVTLVQKATILALGQRVNQTGNSSQLSSEDRVRVTLAVKPESAELIRVAEGHGELSLTLRGADDDEIVEIDQPATLASIIKMEEPVEVAQREVRDMDIYRGQSRSRVRFTRDRDTGHDDFQQWILVQPQPASDRQSNDNQIDAPPNPEGPQRVAPNSASPRDLSEQKNRYLNRNYPNGVLIEDRQWLERQRLQSDFRKLRTLFNPEPDLRDRSDNKRPINFEDQNTNKSDEISDSGAQDNVRSAKLVELFDPESWE